MCMIYMCEGEKEYLCLEKFCTVHFFALMFVNVCVEALLEKVRQTLPIYGARK